MPQPPPGNIITVLHISIFIFSYLHYGCVCQLFNKREMMMMMTPISVRIWSLCKESKHFVWLKHMTTDHHTWKYSARKCPCNSVVATNLQLNDAARTNYERLFRLLTGCFFAFCRRPITFLCFVTWSFVIFRLVWVSCVFLQFWVEICVDFWGIQ